jgi:hypothetical protein
LCVYFWNHDVGIGGGPTLLFGPPLVMVGSLVLYHLTNAVIGTHKTPQSGPGHWTLRIVGLAAILASCPIGFGTWL